MESTPVTTIANGDVYFYAFVAGLAYTSLVKTYMATSNLGSLPSGDLELSYSGGNGTIYSSTTAPANVGDYTITAKVAASTEIIPLLQK